MNGLFCQHCGELNEAQAQFCRKCGASQQPQAVPQAAAGTVAQSSVEQPPYPLVPGVGGQVPPGYPPAPPAAAAQFRGYAGFWIRFLALIIDGAILSVASIPLWMVFAGAVAALGVTHPVPGEEPDPRVALAVLPIFGLFMLAVVGAGWLYEALMTSSSKQGTVGKMALGLKVTDTQGNRITFLRATARYFAKWINGFTLYIGYIMAGFTDRKQGLHDMIASTYVIKA